MAEVTTIAGSAKTKSQMDYNYWNKNNPAPGITAAAHEKRDATDISIVVSHASGRTNKSIIGIFDQTFTIIHSFDVPIQVAIHPSYLDSGNFSRWQYPLPAYVMDGVSSGDSRLTFTPEATQGLALPTGRKVIEVVELRQAIPVFNLYISFPGGAPTKGELEIHNIRRY